MYLDISNLNRFQWTTGWTIMQPFVISGQTYLLSYKEMDGTAAIDKITPDGQVHEVNRSHMDNRLDHNATIRDKRTNIPSLIQGNGRNSSD